MVKSPAPTRDRWWRSGAGGRWRRAVVGCGTGARAGGVDAHSSAGRRPAAALPRSRQHHRRARDRLFGHHRVRPGAGPHAGRGLCATRLYAHPQTQSRAGAKGSRPAVKIDPDYAQAYVNRGNFWTVSNQPERAIADAERALKLAPDCRSPISCAPARSQARPIRQARSPTTAKCSGSIRTPAPMSTARAAAPTTATAITIAPSPITMSSSSSIRRTSASISTAATRCAARASWRRAGGDYGHAIELAPDDPGGWSGRGQTGCSRTTSRGAVTDFDTAIRLARRRQQLSQSRRRLVAAGRESPRVAGFRKGHRARTKKPLPFVNRGLALHELGDNAGAFAAVNVALKLVPGFPPALDALKKIGTPQECRTDPCPTGPAGDAR